MKKTKSYLLALVCSLGLNAQTKKQQDVKSIKDMCGCHEVTFNYNETFNYSKSVEYKASEEMHSKAIEYIFLMEEKDNKLALQHLLVVGNPAKPMIVKHWRQDWLYENTDLFPYDDNRTWKHVKKLNQEVEGQWTQRVLHVDDGPRYEGTATWVHVDGKHYWENTTDAPLARREYKQRNDYNVLRRNNRHEIINGGWVHEQDNKKIIRTSGADDFVLAEEKGYNTYMKIDESKCQAAKDWWAKNNSIWAIVREKWENVYAKKQDIKLRHKIDGKKLFEHLFDMTPKTKASSITTTMDRYIK